VSFYEIQFYMCNRTRASTKDGLSQGIPSICATLRHKALKSYPAPISFRRGIEVSRMSSNEHTSMDSYLSLSLLIFRTILMAGRRLKKSLKVPVAFEGFDVQRVIKPHSLREKVFGVVGGIQCGSMAGLLRLATL
jgi:hypothetical protein